MPLTPLTAGVTIAGSLATQTYSELIPFQPDRSRRSLERKYANEASEFVDIGDVELHYRDEGSKDAQPLVMLHGTCSSLHTWDDWVSELADEFRLVRLDLPGFGLTGPRESRHTLQGLIDSVGALCDHLELSDVAVAGNSLGGGVAWRFSQARPELVSQLVLVDPGGASLLSHIARHYRTFGTDILPRYATPRMAVRLLLRDAYGDTSKVSDDLVTRYYELLLRSGNRRAVMELASNYRDDYFPENGSITTTNGPALPSRCEPSPTILDEYEMADISVPTLFQWGSEDTWLPEPFGRDLAERIDNSRFITYGGVGHVPMEEAPEITAADAAAFLSS